MKKVTILLGVLLMSVASFSNEIYVSGEAINLKDNIEETQKKEAEAEQGFIGKLMFEVREVFSIPLKNLQSRYKGSTYVGEGMEEGEYSK